MRLRNIFSAMPVRVRIINIDCPVCKAAGRVDSRPPFRKKICAECGGTVKVLALRREQLLKAKERA